MAAPSMRGMIDLHCHWVSAIDDGARAHDDGIAMLEALATAGFSTVYATPHMRVGMFENDRAALEAAYARMQEPLAKARARGAKLPITHLASEHFFDDVVFQRLREGAGLPYPRLENAADEPKKSDASVDATNGVSQAQRTTSPPRSVLIEIPPERFPIRLVDRFVDLKRANLTPVLAHPERYTPVWNDDSCLDPILDSGAFLLLDVCSLVGKYGRASEKAATKLLEDGAYEAACTDAHKPSDVDIVMTALERLVKLAGKEEAERLFISGPKRIVGGV